MFVSLRRLRDRVLRALQQNAEAARLLQTRHALLARATPNGKSSELGWNAWDGPHSGPSATRTQGDT